MKDLPFNSYEFLAILFPGFVFTTYVALSEETKLVLNENNVIEILFLICVSYIAGQVINHVSNLLIEKATNKILNKPVLNLVGSSKLRVLNFLFPAYTGKLSVEFSDKYKNLINATTDTDLLFKTYNTVFTIARDNNDVFLKLNDATRMYGFFRNMSLVFLVLTTYYVCQFFAVPDGNWKRVIFFIFLTATMYYRYLIFYRKHTLELISWYVKEKAP